MEIKLDKVTADYQLGPMRTPRVLDAVDINLKPGTFTAVVGHTGAGKSSLLKVLNGLLLPNNGQVMVGDTVIKQDDNKKALKAIRKRVGMVFQFPEAQLFAETVEKDICFGPLNFGVSLSKAKEIARVAIKQVGLDESLLSKSPFSLSGGQKRRVAIAGVLAMEPDILVLDEPGAGLDPTGKKEILSLISSWNRTKQLTTVLVTHDMDDVARFADDVAVMEKGQVVSHDTVRNTFSNQDQLDKWHIDLPSARRFQLKLEQTTGLILAATCLTEEELADALIKVGLV
ncbi:energy-coupling factor transporter ATPase [Aquibacillus sediminis]|uniref:energy-coupling factor transporter ATPase n=1 Tax=Aquibacillus sediminis TaxID=2574734 RepID=UPI0011097BE2|nr:energy-coupling factor transporter ATPase [Aquibacillus sediminis]